MAVYKQDIIDINLNSGNIYRSFLNHAIGFGDNAADHFGVRVFRDGEPVTLSSVTVQGFFRNSQGQNIALVSGTVEGNVAYVTLPQACYNYEGQFTLAIKLVGGGVTGTMRIVDGFVDNTNSSGTVAPTGTVPTYQEIIAQYNAMVAATEGALVAVAPEYEDLTFPVAKGSYCVYSGHSYRAKQNIPTQEAFTASHWEEKPVGAGVTENAAILEATDNAPTSGSSHLVKSGGTYDMIKAEEDRAKGVENGKLNKPSGNGVDGQILRTNGDGTTKWQNQIKVDAVPVSGSNNAVSSNGAVALVESEKTRAMNAENMRVMRPSTNGLPGQVLRTNGDGSTDWVNVGTPTDAQAETAINAWLDAHPDATTTVQDGSLTVDKFSADLKEKTLHEYVTPEMFGAVGDGQTDDTEAIQAAIDYVKTHYDIRKVQFHAKAYLITETLDLSGCKDVDIIGATEIVRNSSETQFTRISYNGSGAAVLFDGTYSCTMKGILIVHTGEGGSGDGSIGIHFGTTRCSRNKILYCSLNGFSAGIQIDNGMGYDTIEGVHFYGCRRGIKINDATGIAPNYIYIDRCAFQYVGYQSGDDVAGIEINEGEYIYISRCDFVAGTGILIPSGGSSSMHDIYLDENIFFQCLESVHVETRVWRMFFRQNTHRLGTYAGCTAITINTTGSFNVMIDDVFFFQAAAGIDPVANTTYPFIYLKGITNVDFRSKMSGQNDKAITGASDEPYPMAFASCTFTEGSTLFGEGQSSSLTPGAHTFNFSRQRMNWVKPTSFQVFRRGYLKQPDVDVSISITGRQCSLTLTNNESSNVAVAIIPFLVQS